MNKGKPNLKRNFDNVEPTQGILSVRWIELVLEMKEKLSLRASTSKTLIRRHSN